MELTGIAPLQLDAYIGKHKNRVSLVSVELEGAWTELPKGVQRLEGDSSVFRGRMPAGAKHLGELPVGPTVPAGINELIRRNHPQKVNDTCGMHMHMSFDSLWWYQLLMVPEYPASVLYYLTKWAERNGFKPDHHIFSRLRGESEYCQNLFWPDLQVAVKRKLFDHHAEGHRYTSVHYCSRFNTVEVRVLPMMEKLPLAFSAIHEVIAITNAALYVLGSAKRGNLQRIQASVPEDLVYEETIIEEV